jgi:hypothetical protein
MRISRCYPNFCRTCRQTLSEILLLYQAYHLPNRNLGHVCVDRHWPESHLTVLTDYVTRVRSTNLPLRLLTENEVFRLMVWANPTNDPKRGYDQYGTASATLAEVCLKPLSCSLSYDIQNSWVQIIRTLWHINPAIAVHLPERFKSPIVRNEVSKLVRSSTLEAVDVPEALPFLLSERLDPKFRRDFRVSTKASLICSTLTSED